LKPWRVPFPKFGDGPCLARVARVASALQLDLASFGAAGAVVVGSNGKGSTAAMTAALLQQTLGRVGLFTSPHMLDLNERFRIDGVDIADDDLNHHWRRVLAAAARAGEAAAMGGFEFLFLVAADWFAAQCCAATVWEAGIGGRLDPTRLIAARRLAITSLDFEHTALLGGALDDIARNKIDAAPEGAVVYVSESCAPVRHAIEAHCNERRVSCAFVSADASLKPTLVGNHQRGNATLAVRLATDIMPIDAAQVACGLAATRWPGRLEVLQSDPLVVIDVGHSPAAVGAAFAGFAGLRGERPAVLVCGVSEDKDAAAILAPLVSQFDVVICTAARHRGLAAALVAAQAAQFGAAQLVIADDIAEARQLALHRAGPAGAIYVAGGFFVAAEFKAAHLGRDPASLVFF